MSILHTRMQKLLLATLSLSAVMLPSSSFAQPGDVATTPIFTQNAVDPNIILSLDDSGSMDWEMLFPTSSGILWWDNNNESFVDSTGTPNFIADSLYLYLFPNGLGFDNGRKDTGIFETIGPLPPFKQFAFARSAAYNNSYFNPSVTYSPWESYAQQTFGNIDEEDAPADPFAPADDATAARDADRFDLTTVQNRTGLEESFLISDNMVVPEGTVFFNGTSWVTLTSDFKATSPFSLNVEYAPATYYRVINTGTYSVNDFSASTVNGDCSTPTQDHYPFLERSPGSFSGSTGVDTLGPDGRCLTEVTITAGTDEMQNFANWFSYYRKRHLSLRAGLGLSFANISSSRVGMFTINNLVDVNMLDIDTQADKDTIYDDFYSFPIGGGTPNRAALNFAGQQYERTNSGAPITDECQKNHTIFFTDGFTNDTPDADPNFTTPFTGIGDADGDNGVPYADPDNSNTLADIAMKYYEDNLNTNFPAGQVPVTSQCNVDVPDAQLDCNTNLHMVTYTIGLGAQGGVYNNTFGGNFYDEVADVYANPITWPDVGVGSTPSQIDDLYHAAVNGRGEILNAATPAALEAALESALTSITEQIGSASSVAFNTSVLSTGSVVYQARFNTDKWAGELLSFSLDPSTGNVAETETWDAGDVIPASGDRVIYTYNPDSTVGDGSTTDKSKGVLFNASTSTDLSDTNLPAVAIADIGFNLPNEALTPDLTAKDRLNYLRGDRTFEGPEPDTGLSRFRVRSDDTVLGDIVHSAPLFVGNPALNWPTGDGSAGSFPSGADAYSTWSDSINRTGIVYVGANDGMLHGFRASDGVEVMAYIPSVFYSETALASAEADADALAAQAAADADPTDTAKAAAAAAAAATATTAKATATAANDGLYHLSDPDYQHRYYVDNTPSRTDAFIKSRNADGTIDNSRDWHSVLVGTLRGGGKGVFALDVTDPNNFANTTSSAAETALWEFDSSDNADLGLTFSRPTIVPTNATDGSAIRWAAIFGNGYNNGGDCRAKLFVLFLDGGLDGTWTIGEGNDYLVLDTEVGSTASGDCNGLSNVAVVDLNGDGKADSAYAGDIKGNMWAFDLCNAPTSGQNQGICTGTGWGVAHSSGTGQNVSPAPLFTAKDASGGTQPITGAPIVISHPSLLSAEEPNVLVLFGTGQYLTDADKDNPATVRNSYYGVWDRGDGSLLRANLFEQTFEAGFGAGADFRITGTGEPDYTGTNGDIEYGWYIDLPDTSEDDNSATGAAERVVTRSVVIGDIVFFNTLVPTVDGCDVGGYGYLMSVLTNNGGRPDSSIINTDSNIIINDADFKTLPDGSKVAVIGEKSERGILSEPAFLGDKRYESTSKGDILKDDVNLPESIQSGRFSWTELRAE